MSGSEFLAAVDEYAKLTADAFGEQARRLGDTSCLAESRDILLLQIKTISQLGTIEHEVAVKTLQDQIALLEPKARASRRGFLQRLLDRLKPRASASDDIFVKTADAFRFAKHDSDPELNAAYIEAMGAIEKAEASLNSMRRIERKIDTAFLVLEGTMHARTYTRLWLQRVLSFIGKHTFVLLGPILVLGFGYSWLTGQAREIVERLPGVTIWHVVGFVVLGYLIKEYVLSKRLKAIRLRVETWLLVPVVHRVFVARLQALFSETVRRKPVSVVSAQADEG
jgi:hypothetical protein